MATAFPYPAGIRHWWRKVLADVDRQAVVARVRDEAGWNARYVFMILMAGGIAVLGLLLSSPAVIIGAMLISPLMGPIIGLGFGLATLDSAEIRRSLVALAGGMGLAVVFCAAIVLLSPLQNVTPEIAARTRPNLFDLVVALFSALAGAYAVIRGREGTIVGVAIATALMPPLAVVGFGIATWNWTVFSGALLLFVTNFVTIALSAAMMARLYGFARSLSPRQSLVQNIAIALIFLLLAVPLALSLRQIAWEAAAARQARDAVAGAFGKEARISQIDLDYAAQPLGVSATVLTPAYKGDAQAQIAARLAKELGRPVDVSIDQYRVGTEAGDAEAAQLASARDKAQRDAALAEAARVADRLALVAGVFPDKVTVDRDKHQAVVTAEPLAGTTMAGYRALEARVAATVPDWQVTLVPPASAPLPDIDVSDGTPEPEALRTAIWAAERLHLGLTVSGQAEAASTVADALVAAHVDTAMTPTSGYRIHLAWRLPQG